MHTIIPKEPIFFNVFKIPTLELTQMRKIDHHEKLELGIMYQDEKDRGRRFPECTT